MNNDPFFPYIPYLGIRTYSLFIFFSFLATYYAINFLLKKKKINYPYLPLFSFSIFSFSLISSKIWDFFFNWDHFQNHSFQEFIKNWNSGLSIQGGVLFGSIIGFFFIKKDLKKRNISFLLFIDCVFINLFLGQAIGRWGNFFNQELLGQKIESTFLIDLFSPIGKYLRYKHEINIIRHPLFFYEFLLNFSAWLFFFFFLSMILKNVRNYYLFFSLKKGKKWKSIFFLFSFFNNSSPIFNLNKGVYASFYFIFYGLFRLNLENLRQNEDIMYFYGIKTALLFAFFSLFIGIFMLFFCQVIFPFIGKNKKSNLN
jgi:prolipoprotein diacylglyceryl transferase